MASPAASAGRWRLRLWTGTARVELIRTHRAHATVPTVRLAKPPSEGSREHLGAGGSHRLPHPSGE